MTHYGDKILQGVRNEARQEEENVFVRQITFQCFMCNTSFDPILRVQVGEHGKIDTEKVFFSHPITLRNSLEKLFCVDDNYRSLKQLNVNTIR